MFVHYLETSKAICVHIQTIHNHIFSHPTHTITTTDQRHSCSAEADAAFADRRAKMKMQKFSVDSNNNHVADIEYESR